MIKKFAYVALASATVLFAEPVVTGDWTISGDVQGYPIDESCTFNQAKEKVGGVCKNAEGKSFETTVTEKEKKVVIVHGGEYQGEALTLTFTGAWNDKGELAGDIDVQPMNVSGSFTAKKAQPK